MARVCSNLCRLAMLLVVLGGCACGDQRGLAALDDRQLALEFRGPTRSLIDAVVRFRGVGEHRGTNCPQYRQVGDGQDLVARLNDRPFNAISHGGRRGCSRDDDPDCDLCEPIRFEMYPPTVEALRAANPAEFLLEVSDTTGTLRLRTADLFRALLRLEQPTDGKLGPGDEVTMAWNAPGDANQPVEVLVTEPGGVEAVKVTAVTRTTTGLTFRCPPLPLAPGYSVVVVGQPSPLAVTECLGAQLCQAETSAALAAFGFDRRQ